MTHTFPICPSTARARLSPRLFVWLSPPLRPARPTKVPRPGGPWLDDLSLPLNQEDSRVIENSYGMTICQGWSWTQGWGKLKNVHDIEEKKHIECIQLQGPRTMPQPGSRPASSTPWHPHLERPPDLTKTIEIMKWVEAIPCLLAIHGSCWNVWTGSGKLIECYRVRVLYGCVPSPSPALGEGIMRWHYEDYAKSGTWKKLTCPSWLESQTLVRFIISQSGLYFSSHSLGIQHGSRAQISHFLSLKNSLEHILPNPAPVDALPHVCPIILIGFQPILSAWWKIPGPSPRTIQPMQRWASTCGWLNRGQPIETREKWWES